MLLNMKYLDLP